MSTSVIAEIQSIQGTAYAVAVDGNKRTLQLGDQLFEGEVLETSEGGAVQLLLTDGSSYEVVGIPQLLLSAELLAGADSSRDENEVAATTFDALVEEGFGDTLEAAIAQSDTVVDEALDEIFEDELEETAAGGPAGSGGGAGSTFVQADRIDTGNADATVDGIGNVDLTANEDVTAEQDEPTQAVANDDAFSINEDTPSTGNLADNDTLLGGETYQIAEGGAPANGTLEITADGVFFYTPNENYSGEDSFTYAIVSVDGQVSTATVSLSVVPVNDAPIAQDDQLICPEDESLTSIDLVANDVDPDGDTLTVVDVQSSNGADITFNEDGTINYKPAPNYVGTDTLTYTVEDGAGAVSTATITVEVTPINDAPVAEDFALTTTQDESINSIDVLSSASDVDGDTISMVSGESSSGGVVQINADGTMNYTPPAGFVGTDIVTYSIQDSAGVVVEAKVTITVDPIDGASGGSSGGDGSITDGSGPGAGDGMSTG